MTGLPLLCHGIDVVTLCEQTIAKACVSDASIAIAQFHSTSAIRPPGGAPRICNPIATSA